MPQPEKRPQQPPRRSALEKPNLELVRPDAVSPAPNTQGSPDTHVRPDLKVCIEPLALVVRELPPLIAAHWAESEPTGLPLDPDWDRMFMLANNGMLLVSTARDQGRLVGYIFVLVVPHVYSRTSLQAEIQPFYLDPAYRGGWFVSRWLKGIEEILRLMEVKRIHAAVPHRVGALFKHLGYASIETVWYKTL